MLDLILSRKMLLKRNNTALMFRIQVLAWLLIPEDSKKCAAFMFTGQGGQESYRNEI
jgi:hypothetical protein